jgi:hypothetical protein
MKFISAEGANKALGDFAVAGHSEGGNFLKLIIARKTSSFNAAQALK